MIKSFFSEVQRVKPAIASPDALEVYYLGKGWQRGEKEEKPAPGMSVTQLKAMAMMAKASGVEVDKDVEDMLKSVVGSTDEKTDEFNFLKDEDATLEEIEKKMQDKLSFNFPIPNNMKELEALYQKMAKEAPKAKEEDGEEGKEEASGDEKQEEKGAEDEAKTMSEKEEAERIFQNAADQQSSYEDKISEKEIEEGLAAMKELDEETERSDIQDQGDNKARATRVKGDYDDWSKMLKERDVWNKK